MSLLLACLKCLCTCTSKVNCLTSIDLTACWPVVDVKSRLGPTATAAKKATVVKKATAAKVTPAKKVTAVQKKKPSSASQASASQTSSVFSRLGKQL